MKTIRNSLAVATALFLMLLGDAPPDSRSAFGLQLVSEAHAVMGVWRRHARRWAVVGTAAVATTAAAEQSAAAQQQSTAPPVATQQQSAPAQQQSVDAATGSSLPLGTVVASLPSGCTTKTVSDVAYYHCGSNYYRAVFQGNNLVYVTAKP